MKKKKKTHLSAGHFFSPSRSVVFPCFFQRLPCAKWRKLQTVPRFCAVFLLCFERGPMYTTVHFSMGSGDKSTPFTCWSPELSGHSLVLTSRDEELARMGVAQLSPPFPGQGEPVYSKSGRLSRVSRAQSISKPSKLCWVQGLKRR